MFQSGSADLTTAGKRALQHFFATFKSVGKEFRISVEGHTDSLPIRNKKFANNWELSAARSLVVIKDLLMGGIDRSRLEVRALADTQPLGESLRRNRRVSIVIF